jgi:acyl-coenzyme A thioesterase PaaI-like protein
MTGLDAQPDHDRLAALWPVGTYLRVEQWAPPSFDGDRVPTSLWSRVPVDAHLVDEAGGLHAGALVTAVDALGGYLSGLAVQPDGIVTTSMALRTGRRHHVGPLLSEATVLRKGRASVVTQVSVVDEGDSEAAVASCLMTCAVLHRGASAPTPGRQVHHPMAPAQPDPVSLQDFFGVQPGSGPVTRLDIGDHLRNNWGILHGGAIAVLSDLAALRAVQSGGPPPVGRSSTGRSPAALSSTDMVLHYLAPARVGPVEARCTVMGTRPDGTVVRVALYDTAVNDRMVALASVTVRPV